MDHCRPETRDTSRQGRFLSAHLDLLSAASSLFPSLRSTFESSRRVDTDYDEEELADTAAEPLTFASKADKLVASETDLSESDTIRGIDADRSRGVLCSFVIFRHVGQPQRCRVLRRQARSGDCAPGGGDRRADRRDGRLGRGAAGEAGGGVQRGQAGGGRGRQDEDQVELPPAELRARAAVPAARGHAAAADHHLRGPGVLPAPRPRLPALPAPAAEAELRRARPHHLQGPRQLQAAQTQALQDQVQGKTIFFFSD